MLSPRTFPIVALPFASSCPERKDPWAGTIRVRSGSNRPPARWRRPLATEVRDNQETNQLSPARRTPRGGRIAHSISQTPPSFRLGTVDWERTSGASRCVSRAWGWGWDPAVRDDRSGLFAVGHDPGAWAVNLESSRRNRFGRSDRRAAGGAGLGPRRCRRPAAAGTRKRSMVWDDSSPDGLRDLLRPRTGAVRSAAVPGRSEHRMVSGV
jgi:hypothetical protein